MDILIYTFKAFYLLCIEVFRLFLPSGSYLFIRSSFPILHIWLQRYMVHSMCYIYTASIPALLHICFSLFASASYKCIYFSKVCTLSWLRWLFHSLSLRLATLPFVCILSSMSISCWFIIYSFSFFVSIGIVRELAALKNILKILIHDRDSI